MVVLQKVSALSAALSRQWRFFFSAGADVYTTKNAGYRRANPLFLANPRPTQYQPRIAAAVSTPPQAIRIRIMYYIWGLGIAALIIPCIQSYYEIQNYYSRYSKFYKDGWKLFHYADLEEPIAKK